MSATFGIVEILESCVLADAAGPWRTERATSRMRYQSRPPPFGGGFFSCRIQARRHAASADTLAKQTGDSKSDSKTVLRVLSLYDFRLGTANLAPQSCKTPPLHVQRNDNDRGDASMSARRPPPPTLPPQLRDAAPFGRDRKSVV